jgi:hypothetical protein
MLVLGWALATLPFFGSQANNPLTSDPADVQAVRRHRVGNLYHGTRASAFDCSGQSEMRRV